MQLLAIFGSSAYPAESRETSESLVAGGLRLNLSRNA
jgi:hypothetical protein